MESFFIPFITRWSYLGLFLVLVAAGLGLPLPEDIPLVASGWLVHKGEVNGTNKPDLYLMIATGMFGVLLGDSIVFAAGRRYGDHFVEHRWLRRFARPWLVEKARQKYKHHGAKIIFAARFMPGLRSVLFLTAGTFRVPYWKFLMIDGLAAMISVPAWIWAASKFSGSLEELFGEAKTASYVIFSGLLVALVIWGVWEYFRYLRKRNGAISESSGTEPSPPPNSDMQDRISQSAPRTKGPDGASLLTTQGDSTI